MIPRIWLLVKEPRIVTAFTASYWLLVTVTGAAAILSPPLTVAHHIGPILTLVWGFLVLTGGILGFIGCLPGWWWVERAGIIAATTGTLMYLAVVVALHFQEPSSRLVPAGFVVLSLFAYVIRWVRIMGPQVDPARGATK